MKNFVRLLGLILLIAFPSTLIAQDDEEEPIPDGAVIVLTPNIIEKYPHDPEAFTQGLVLHEGVFYESTGLYGSSDLRQVDPETGEVLELREVDEEFFAEGLALVDDRLIQITWQETTAFVYDLETFEPIEEFTYEGQGWGLCYDGETLYMSDGSAMITLRDPETFEALETYEVMLQGQPVIRINELECVDDVIYANIWPSDFIVRFDKSDGVITAVIDTSRLLTAEDIESVERIDVLNGIAYNAESETFLITGKLWPVMFEVEFVEAGFIPPPVEQG